MSALTLHFTPHLSYHGKLDEWLGINLFWSEKAMILLLYLQRLSLLLLWNLKWPYLFYRRMDFAFGFLLDFTAHHTGIPPLGEGTIFKGCDTICKLVWPASCVTLLFLWSGIHLLENTSTYYTRNIERLLWTAVRLMVLPFGNALLRYFILNQEGDLDIVASRWVTPISEIGVFFALLLVAAFVGIAYVRCSKQVLFDSQIRHEAFLRSRELEYLLKFSTGYRNDRLWMISSFTYYAWPWSIIRGVLDVVLLLVMNFVPVQYGVVAGVVLLTCVAAYSLIFVRVYRCSSSNALEMILDWTLVIFAIFGLLQSFSVRNALLVDTNLDYFLFGLHGCALALFLLMCVYFFLEGHNFGRLSVAEQRATNKWKKVFLGATDEELKRGCCAKLFGGGSKDFVEFKPAGAANAADNGDDADEMGKEKFVQDMRKQQQSDIQKQVVADRFYIPKQSGFLTVNTASTHVWPVNNIIVNELLRRNTQDHLVDVLRAARKMLDRISALHNTPVLIPTDELKTHINRLKACLAHVQRERVTHHCGVIHPLQTTFEDLIDQFTYELRVFSGRSVTVGHNARKMIEVSRYLRLRMQKRDRTLALFSPVMRRILMKLFALRIFIQLVNDRPTFLLPQADKPFAEATAADFQSSDDSDDGQQAAAGPKTNFVAFGEADDAADAFMNDDGDDDDKGADGGHRHRDHDGEADDDGVIAYDDNKGGDGGEDEEEEGIHTQLAQMLARNREVSGESKKLR